MQSKVEQQLDEIIKLIKEINNNLGGNNENQQPTDEESHHQSVQNQ